MRTLCSLERSFGLLMMQVWYHKWLGQVEISLSLKTCSAEFEPASLSRADSIPQESPKKIKMFTGQIADAWNGYTIDLLLCINFKTICLLWWKSTFKRIFFHSWNPKWFISTIMFVHLTWEYKPPMCTCLHLLTFCN